MLGLKFWRENSTFQGINKLVRSAAIFATMRIRLSLRQALFTQALSNVDFAAQCAEETNKRVKNCLIQKAENILSTYLISEV